MSRTILIAFAACAAMVFSCGSRDTGTSAGTHPVVIMRTNMGTMEFTLDAEKAPITVKNFLSYVNEGFYDNTIFHRVIPNFMIQGGGFTRTMAEKKTRRGIKNEAGNGLSNTRGSIAMARKDAVNSATSQFFINLSNNTPLNHKDTSKKGFGYAVFGQVTSGMDTADRIASMETRSDNTPIVPVVIQSVRVKGRESEPVIRR